MRCPVFELTDREWFVGELSSKPTTATRARYHINQDAKMGAACGLVCIMYYTRFESTRVLCDIGITGRLYVHLLFAKNGKHEQQNKKQIATILGFG